MKTIKVQKGNTIKTINEEYKKDYINAGWGEVQTTTSSQKIGSFSSPNRIYEKNKY